MKTTFKTLTDQRKAQQKRRVFELKTGLKWQCYHTGQGMNFTPIITKDTPTDRATADALLPHLTKDYLSFVKLSELSHLKLEAVLIGAKTLVKDGQAVPTVNRMGGFAAVRKS